MKYFNTIVISLAATSISDLLIGVSQFFVYTTAISLAVFIAALFLEKHNMDKNKSNKSNAI